MVTLITNIFSWLKPDSYIKEVDRFRLCNASIVTTLLGDKHVCVWINHLFLLQRLLIVCSNLEGLFVSFRVGVTHGLCKEVVIIICEEDVGALWLLREGERWVKSDKPPPPFHGWEKNTNSSVTLRLAAIILRPNRTVLLNRNILVWRLVGA